jgi:hypothetical protein
MPRLLHRSGEPVPCPSATGPCNAAATVQLVEPETMFEDRGTQLDVRLSKIFRFGRSRLQAKLDAYNLTNAGDVLSVQNRYGPNWLRPINILASQMFKVSAQFDF